MRSLQATIVLILLATVHLCAQVCNMPAEDELHEGTWLQWPHQYEYGISYRNSLDPTWIAMTAALVQSEKVHIIAYNATEQSRITALLNNAGVNMANVDFQLFQTNDVWVRDNGPIFVRDSNDILTIEDWGFNGWGGKYNYTKCNAIPGEVAWAIGMPLIDLNAVMTVEGGAYLVDGRGVLMACRSSILSQSPANTVRNPGMTQAQAESIFSSYLGISKFIWLDGLAGADITDMHIDGFAQFANDSTIVTMDSTDLDYWELSPTDIQTLYAATDINNIPYHFVYLPLTQNNVLNTNGDDIGYKGSYCNYYIANTVVLVPNYNDPNDNIANNMIQALYPNRTVIGIDVRNLYENGGMVHCVTQQQPALFATRINATRPAENELPQLQSYPNPAGDNTTVVLSVHKEAYYRIIVYNSKGVQLTTLVDKKLKTGDYNMLVDLSNYPAGMYYYVLSADDMIVHTGKIAVVK